MVAPWKMAQPAAGTALQRLAQGQGFLAAVIGAEPGAIEGAAFDIAHHHAAGQASGRGDCGTSISFSLARMAAATGCGGDAVKR